MAYLGVIEAVRARLEGNDPKFVPSYPFDMTQRSDPGTMPEGSINSYADAVTFLSRTSEVFVEGQFRIPILFFGPEGNLFERVYPSMTYEVIAAQPRFNEALFSSSEYGAEVYHIPINPSSQAVVDSDGTELGPAARMVRKRVLEHPLDVLFEVRVYSKDFLESAMLVDHVYSVFPPRHFIRVPHKDGSHRSWDLMFLEFKDLDQREATIQGAIDREYCKVFTYKVEGYFDNTDRSELINLIRLRKLSTATLPSQ